MPYIQHRSSPPLRYQPAKPRPRPLLTIIIIPLTYNIAFGVIAGILSYVILNGGAWILRKVSGGRIVPANYDLAETWTVPPGGIVPGWVKALQGRNRTEDVVPMEQRPAHSPSLDEHTKGSLASEL